jgi:uncharacterized protein (DUF302 family)
MKRFLLVLLGFLCSGIASAEQAVIYPFKGSFDDATFNVESSILDKGLVIDHVSHTGEMLARTGADLGATKEIYKAADIFLFCSAVLSRKMMEINPLNIAHCPYSIFVFEDTSGVTIGFRNYPKGEMKEVQALLDSIVQIALEE